MRIEDNKIFVRQSWLGDALMCPERARLMEQNPSARRENDSAVMGTACHAAIEAVLNGSVDATDIGSFGVHSFHAIQQDLASQGKAVNVTNTDPSKWETHIASMCEAWVRDIYPSVPLGGETEKKFAVRVGSVENNLYEYELWFEGTMDYLSSSGIWDWKTAARKYNENEKQIQNIQSAIYAEAAVRLGVLEYPLQFNFGVMIRNASSSGQIVRVKRKPEHANWVVAQATALINSILLSKIYLPQERWPVNDQHHLCSERWCPVWSMCKGSFISERTNSAEEA